VELRHLRYFIAVAETGSMTEAAEQRLHTAQPSLSRQIRDLEAELGVTLLIRGARGVELTPAGKVFLDHARMVFLQVEAATEAARRAAEPAKTSFTIGFLSGYEMDWLPPVMSILRDELPDIDVVITSQESPNLAAALVRGKIDVAFLRPEKQASGLAYRLLRKDPLIVVMPADHRLAAQDSISPEEIVGETLIGVPAWNAPQLRAVTDRYAAQIGIDLTPDHEALNLSMGFSLIASTGGIGLLPLYARKLMPNSVVSRPIRGAPPMIDLVLGYSEANTSPLLKFLQSKVEDLKFRVSALQSN
jgi:LysR family transcriptional regulator, hca operon transcriptional activator